MKKSILLVAILVLLTSLVAANYANVENVGDEYHITYSTAIQKGWNLLPSDPLTVWNFDDYYGSLENVKVVYLYGPVENTYVETKAGLHADDLAKVKKSMDYLSSSAAWYYFTKEDTITYTVPKDITVKLHEGWNLLSIHPALTSLNEDVSGFPVGDCTVEKIYMWNGKTQAWTTFGDKDEYLDELAEPDAVGASVAIKVQNSCQFGDVTSTAPPALPGSESTSSGSSDSSGETCVDTDNDGTYDSSDPNKNKVKGTTTGLWNHDFSKDKTLGKPLPKEGSISDRCLGVDELQAGKLLETYCSSDGYATGIVKACEDGNYCTDGACVACSGSSCPTCFDSDDGVDSFSPGTVTGMSADNMFITRSDSCINLGGVEYANGQVIVGASAVKEFSCNNNVVGSSQVTCEFGCNSGRCMEQSEADSWTSS